MAEPAAGSCDHARTSAPRRSAAMRIRRRDGRPIMHTTAGNHGCVPAASWPTSVDELIEAQRALATVDPTPWEPPDRPVVAGCFVSFERGYTGAGRAGDPGWSAAAAFVGKRRIAQAGTTGEAGAPYMAGLLALRL